MKANEFKPHAAITLSNSGGIEIMLNRSNDGVYYRFNYGQDNLEKEKIYEKEILYTTPESEEEESQPYFKHRNTKYFLSEAMRINH
jgi:hypothetical protein